MQMRLLIIFTIFFLTTCSEDTSKKDIFKNVPIDNLKIVLYERGVPGTPIPFHPTEEEREEIKHWLNSFSKLDKFDFMSYAPTLVLENDQMDVNFLNDWRVVITYKKTIDGYEGWPQFSRKPTKEDKKIMSILKNRIEEAKKQPELKK